jgi:hypothetical protein
LSISTTNQKVGSGCLLSNAPLDPNSNSTNTYVTLGTITFPATSTGLSICFWANITGVNHGLGRLISFLNTVGVGPSITFALMTDGRLAFNISSGANVWVVLTTPNYINSTWTHYAFVINASGYVIYGTSTYTGTDTYTAGTYSSNTLLSTGTSYGGKEFCIGSIDEFRVYQKAITPQEVNAIYNYR